MQLRESELGLMETGEERQKSLAGYVWRDGMYKTSAGFVSHNSHPFPKFKPRIRLGGRTCQEAR